MDYVNDFVDKGRFQAIVSDAENLWHLDTEWWYLPKNIKENCVHDLAVKYVELESNFLKMCGTDEHSTYNHLNDEEVFDNIIMSYVYDKTGYICFDDVFKALTEYPSFEPDGFGMPTYYLHIQDDGSILSGCDGADKTFTCYCDYADDLDCQQVYDLETEDNADFIRIVETLWMDANSYLENIKRESEFAVDDLMYCHMI